MKGKSRGIETFELLEKKEAESPGTAAYLAAFRLLERKAPGTREAFTALVRDFPDDPLAAFHLERLKRGETGVTVILSRK